MWQIYKGEPIIKKLVSEENSRQMEQQQQKSNIQENSPEERFDLYIARDILLLFVFLPFLGPLLRHMEVPRLGV